MNKMNEAAFLAGYNARVNDNEMADRKYATQDGYRCANTLFSKEVALIIREGRLPNYPKAIQISDIADRLQESSEWTELVYNSI